MQAPTASAAIVVVCAAAEHASTWDSIVLAMEASDPWYNGLVTEES